MIHVAGGTYTPDRGGDVQAGDRRATFSIPDGVGVMGGYAGAGETRDPAAFPTFLSGDLEGNDQGDFVD